MKNMKIKKGLIFFLFCLICEEVFAAIFSVAPTDKSQQYLGMVFGGSVGAINLGGGNNPTLALMFERFNFIIVAIGTVVLSYIGIMTTINTAREGEALGKKISLWVPLRAFGGMLLMIPGPTSGYSVVQMTVLWIVLNGIGAANSVWNVVLGQLAQGVSAVGGLNIKLQPSALFPSAKYVLQANTCMYSINTYMPELAQNAGPLQNKAVSIYTVTNTPTPDPSVPIAPAPGTLKQTASVFVGIQGAAFPVDRLCGVFTVTTSITQGDGNTFNYATLSQRLQIKTAALQAMFSTVDPAAQILANPVGPFAPPTPGYIYAAGQAYIGQIAQMATGVQAPTGANAQAWEVSTNPQSAITGNYATLQSYGWIHAGSYYFTMVKASTATLDPELTPGKAVPPSAASVPNGIPAGPPTAAPWPTDSGASTMYDILTLAAERTKMNTGLVNALNYWTTDQVTPPPPSQGLSIDTFTTGNDTLDTIVNGIRNSIQTPILNYIQSIAAGSSSGTFGTTQNANPVDPLISIGQFGGSLMITAELAVFAAMVTAFLISLAMSFGSCASPIAWAINLLFVQILPLVYGIAVILWTLGATLGIYIPLVPYLVFTMTAFGWILQVIEAVVAAPIIALGLVHPANGEELGKIAAALPIIANIFLRPTLMIFGFVLGSSLLRAGIALINFGFIPALQQGATSFFSILAVLGMYVGIITAIVNKSFSLIYLLPNQIMRWMGGQAEHGGPEEMVKEAKGGFDKGADQGQQAANQFLSSSNAATKSAIDKNQASGGSGGGAMPPTSLAGGP